MDVSIFSVEVSRSHSDPPYSFGLLWTSDRSDAEISIWKNTTLTRGRQPWHRWDSNPQSQKSSGQNPRLRRHGRWISHKIRDLSHWRPTLKMFFYIIHIFHLIISRFWCKRPIRGYSSKGVSITSTSPRICRIVRFRSKYSLTSRDLSVISSNYFDVMDVIYIGTLKVVQRA